MEIDLPYTKFIKSKSSKSKQRGNTHKKWINPNENDSYLKKEKQNTITTFSFIQMENDFMHKFCSE